MNTKNTYSDKRSIDEIIYDLTKNIQAAKERFNNRPPEEQQAIHEAAMSLGEKIQSQSDPYSIMPKEEWDKLDAQEEAMLEDYREFFEEMKKKQPDISEDELHELWMKRLNQKKDRTEVEEETIEMWKESKKK